IDNDGDIDLLSSSSNDGKVAWYENTDSLGAFSSEKVISQYGAPTSVYAGDLDGDGDVDVLASSYTTNEVLWFENLNGLGAFDGRQIITSSAYGARDVYASDLDNDGDLDVLSASESDRKIAWYKNLDGQGTFGPTQIIATNKDDAMAVLTADLDNDGDLDIISTQSNIGEVYYNENLNGLGDFSESNLITTFVNSVNCILVIDLDGDGFKDLVSSSKKDDKIAWYRNLDGLGSFGVQRIISRTVDSPRSIYAADLDGDGDMDILSASYYDNTFGWFENLDGLGNFGTQNIIASEEYWPEDIFSIDIDGDGDMDVVSASGNANWFENLDGLGNFSEKKYIEALNANAVFSIDIDGDGDNDVLTGSFDEIAWNENIDGLGVFAPRHIIATNLNNVKDIFAIDIDGDGDVDVLTATYDDDKISWYENTDGLGTFSTEKIITNTADAASGVFGIDMDNDGDIDVLSASFLDHTIAWYENLDGNGNFGVKQIISTNEINAISVFADDLDNDGDIDIFPSAHDYYINGSSNYDKISWYENTSLLNLNTVDTNNDSYNLFPVPTDNVLNIKSNSSISKVEIYNNLGQLVLEKYHSTIINTSTLGKGVYLVKVFDNKGNYDVKRILKN
ncbi:T9SS type A sorting domain-containing protein, partial [Aequorivita viscosa]